MNSGRRTAGRERRAFYAVIGSISHGTGLQLRARDFSQHGVFAVPPGVRPEDPAAFRRRGTGRSRKADRGKFRDALREDRPHVVLHRPGDSGNVGTILRTALGLGLQDAALIRPCVDVFDPRTVRASMGSLFRMRVRVYDSFEEYRKEFPERPLYPFMLDASVPLQQIREIPEIYSLIFGNEGSGLPAEFAAAGQAVRIESNDQVDSLNLAVAAGIGIYYFTR